jgi:hypothetical protein
MKALVEFSYHDYMDMKPTKSVREFTANSLEEITSAAKQYAEDMNKYYSGGTTTFVKVYTPEESLRHCLKEIKDVVEHPFISTSDGSLDSTDVSYLKTLCEVITDYIKF